MLGFRIQVASLYNLKPTCEQCIAHPCFHYKVSFNAFGMFNRPSGFLESGSVKSKRLVALKRLVFTFHELYLCSPARWQSRMAISRRWNPTKKSGCSNLGTIGKRCVRRLAR